MSMNFCIRFLLIINNLLFVNDRQTEGILFFAQGKCIEVSQFVLKVL
jgi:hypothetical protein